MDRWPKRCKFSIDLIPCLDVLQPLFFFGIWTCYLFLISSRWLYPYLWHNLCNYLKLQLRSTCCALFLAIAKYLLRFSSFLIFLIPCERQFGELLRGWSVSTMGISNAPCFHPFSFLPTKMCVCVCVTKLSRVPFCTNEFAPFFVVTEKESDGEEALIFQPPQKTRWHISTQQWSRNTSTLYIVCRNADPSTMHRDDGGTVLRIPGKAGDSWPVFFFAVVTKTGALNGWFEWGKVWGVCGNCSMVLVSRNKNTELV